MGILMLLGLITVGGIIWVMLDEYSAIGMMSAIFGGASLLVALIAIPISRMEHHAAIQEMRAIQQTVEAARQDGESIERFAYLQKVAEANQWLAKAQYYNGTAFDIWIPDAVMGLEPIQ